MNIICLDVHYRESDANAAGVEFGDWADAVPSNEIVTRIANPPPYQSGDFYKRELPCLLEILARCNTPSIVVIDGYVWLEGTDRPGLGAHLYQKLGGAIPVIGVAKTLFRGAKVIEVDRGSSRRPLFVTAAGISAETAAALVGRMHGQNRIPTLLKRVDSLARTGRC